MLKFILKGTFLFLLLGAAPAASTAGKANHVVNVPLASPEIVFNLDVKQPVLGVPSISMTWESTTGGPYNVLVLDMTNGGAQVANFWTNNLFAAINGLTLKNTYRVQVSDNNSTSFQFITLG